jgi:hypothetical protein
MLFEKIKTLYPQLIDSDFIGHNATILLQDDGQGAYIASWNHPTLAKPTDEELA